jgi:hypothetical protein
MLEPPHPSSLTTPARQSIYSSVGFETVFNKVSSLSNGREEEKT